MSTARRVLENVESVVDGKSEAVETAFVVLLAEGHLLIEDVPGVGKTMLARALARSVDCTVRRIQFTPDLLPSDVTGVSVYHQASGSFDFKPGAVFANIVIGDEINRASPKTQSALLEAMEERQVTVDGVTRPLERPFTVIATQNPYEMEGTYALPEAQRDRFTARISMGYPDVDAELEMVRDRDASNPLDRLRPVLGIDDLRAMIAACRAVHVSAAVERYCVDLARATRVDTDVRLGASPRATLQLVRAAKARAHVYGRDYVLPDDVAALVPAVFAHRLVPMRGSAGVEDTVRRIVASTPVPAGASGSR
ncbi:MoxR family ATPase [Aeromicrobium halocynthiae]|uniref:MoxR family ATPase n=1 Tax=Aeromicrobium halocynthiae TaxID=560557 RepID=A0ABN2VY93_9ACTN